MLQRPAMRHLDARSIRIKSRDFGQGATVAPPHRLRRFLRRRQLGLPTRVVQQPEELVESESADRLLEHYRLPGSPLYVVGTFDKGITVLSQQVRALNLAWGTPSQHRRDSA